METDKKVLSMLENVLNVLKVARVPDLALAKASAVAELLHQFEQFVVACHVGKFVVQPGSPPPTIEAEPATEEAANETA